MLHRSVFLELFSFSFQVLSLLLILANRHSLAEDTPPLVLAIDMSDVSIDLGTKAPAEAKKNVSFFLDEQIQEINDALQELAELANPFGYDLVCGIEINTNRSICDELIEESGADCECYDFCQRELFGCKDFGESIFYPDCAPYDIVMGCRKNYTSSLERDDPVPCPPGHICGGREKSISCDSLRELPVILLVGDIHAGIYCPGVEDREKDVGYRNCPAGSYCPNSTTVLPCPAGYFCPHKTVEPKINCPACKEGAKVLERERWGYVVVLVLFLFFSACFLWEAFKRRNKVLYRKMTDLQQQRIGEVKLLLNKKKHQERLERLKPKLDLIYKRATGKAMPEREDSDGRKSLVFNAKELFDQLDDDNSGDLTYDEIAEVLGFEPHQLGEFIRRMNRLAGYSDECTSISRAVFIKYFLQAIETTNLLTPTSDEAEQVFDELAGMGTNKNGEVEFKDFYSSSLSDFLSDTQINSLVKAFQRAQITQNAGDSAALLRKSTTPTAFVERSTSISRDVFVEHYPSLIFEVARTQDAADEEAQKDANAITGFDIAFRDLSLTVKVHDNSFNVVDNLTGRLQAGTMTALMGGSGAGKTSLLNALCGRAFYGEVSGLVHINGQLAKIEDHVGSVGFVPQDDTVYAELTVRENLIYSGRFQLPPSTSIEEIEDLADSTMASLGLSRVMNSIVGDVTRRGISGGEKKRVNIGLELMSKPSILFLDEPTSGLDSTSALLVMKSLSVLAKQQGVTICCVIHQPRKDIFDLFDSLILLGIGGRMVYHGPVDAAVHYFRALNYVLPPGESLADWLIDIAAGHLVPTAKKKSGFKGMSDDMDTDDSTNSSRAFQESGPSANAAEQIFDQERVRRENLYRSWQQCFQTLPAYEMVRYNPPEPYNLPRARRVPPFGRQLSIQVERQILVSQRNWFSIVVDTAVIIGAVVVISMLDGVVYVTDENIPTVTYEGLVEPREIIDFFEELPKLFAYATIPSTINIQQHAMKVGVVVAVLVSLSASRIVTEKRVEFFREAASGYNINAYYFAINIIATVEHAVQVVIASLFGLWLRSSVASWYSYYLHFMLLSWLSVSWALVLPMVLPPKNVVLVTGFFVTFGGLLLSGGIAPVTFQNMYNNVFLGAICGFLSPTRFFVEGMAVSESRCLPIQSGFTNPGLNLPYSLTSFSQLGLGRNDIPRILRQSCDGWYWGLMPSVMVGVCIRCLGAMLIHVCGRAHHAKRSYIQELVLEAKNEPNILRRDHFLTLLCFLPTWGLFAFGTAWAMLK